MQSYPFLSKKIHERVSTGKSLGILMLYVKNIERFLSLGV
jgi:hypothetical protein